MIGLWIGISLIVLGGVLLAVARLNDRRVSASQGSVAIGGDNRGTITNVNIGEKQPPSRGHALTYVAIAVELIGIGVTLWHAYHLARP